MTPQDIIDDVRDLVNDTDALSYRYTTAMLLKFVNSALKRTALLRPDLFSVMSTIPCTQDAVLQSAPADSIRIMEVFGIVGGESLPENSREVMDQNSRGWRQEAAGPAEQWMRNPRSPNQFFIYPKAPVAQVLDIEYAQMPPDYLVGDTIDLSEAYKSAVTDCTIFLAQSIDDEHVSSGRAKLFFDSFVQGLGLAAQQRAVTDFEDAAVQKAPPSGR